MIATCPRRGRLNHGTATRIAHMHQPKFDRVLTGRTRELVHETFDREDVALTAERS